MARGGRRWVLGAVLAAVWACGLPSPPVDFDPGDGSAAPIELAAGDRIRYVLDWSWDGAREQDGALVFTTDLGYEVGLDSLRVAAYSAQLRPCDETAAGWRWGPSVARADHVIQDDASVAVGAVIEDAIHDGWRELGVGVAGGGSYCRGFLLATPLAEGDELDGEAIRATGWYRAPDGGARVAFEAGVPLGDGALGALAAAIPEAVALDPALAARLVFTRYPSRAFDGVDLAALDRLELGWEVLKNLQADTTARWQRAD